MPVKYFVGKDTQDRQLPPGKTHEREPVIEIIGQVYRKFNHYQDRLYALITNLRIPEAYADLIIITQDGIGIVEIKGNYGRIYQQGNIWYAGSIKIKSGKADNPHEQARGYADEIRKQLLFPPSGISYLPKKFGKWENFKFGTAVCFTNPRANLEDIRKSYHPSKLEWENLSKIILTPADIPMWAYNLSFDVSKGFAEHFDSSYILTEEQIYQIVYSLLKATEWTEITSLMPPGKAYAYLSLKHNNIIVQNFGLTADNTTIGLAKDKDCDIILPEPYWLVSRKHAQIIYKADGIYLQDTGTDGTGSTNGTFINGKRVIKEERLHPGDQISLGGQRVKDGVCLLEFSDKPQIIKEIIFTPHDLDIQGNKP